MTSIMGWIEAEHPELFALEFVKIAKYDFVYTPSSTNINQSAPDLVKLYVIIRSQMSSIMDPVGLELSELCAVELENLPYLNLFEIKHLQILTNQYQTWPQYIYALKVLNEFDYGTNQTRTSGVICPWIWKICWNWPCLHSSIYKY